MALKIWEIVIISLSVLLLFICMAILLYKCCWKGKKRKKSAFAWLDRLGIPFAREGTPDMSTLPRGGLPSRYMVKSPGHQKKANGVDNDDFDADDIPPPLEGDDDPFKRLDHIGIPRANRNTTSTDGNSIPPGGKIQIVKHKRPPSTPLPSILSDDSSQDDISFDVLSIPQEYNETLVDESGDLPPPPPELMVNNEPYLDNDEPYMGTGDPYLGNIRSVYDADHVESDYENDFP